MPALTHPSPPLTGAAVVLRPWAEGDIAAGMMGFADPSIQRFSWPERRPYALNDAQAFYVEQERERLSGEALSFALTAPGDPTSVFGGASLYDVDETSAAVGYWLTPSARGRGVATEAVRLLAGWAFDELHVGRIEITCDPKNQASIGVATRCSFEPTGLIPEHVPFKGAMRDSAIFRLQAPR